MAFGSKSLSRHIEHKLMAILHKSDSILETEDGMRVFGLKLVEF